MLHKKKILIAGLSNKWSIAYGIAKVLYKYGAQLAFSYQDTRLKSRIQSIAKECNTSLFFPCNLSHDIEIKNLLDMLKNHWNAIDCIVHSVAFTPDTQICGDFITNINRKEFHITNDISTYSFIALSKFLFPFMHKNNGSIITISYYGAEKAIPNYNVMGIAKAGLESSVRYLALSLGKFGIRVNAISSGPIKTLASKKIKDFYKIQSIYSRSSPLKRNITLEEIGNTAAFLCSDLSSGITAEIIHVDSGFHSIALNS